MQENMGKTDRGLRVAVSIVLLVLTFGTDLVSGGLLQGLFIVIAAVFLLTSALGSCPLYTIFGIRTCRR